MHVKVNAKKFADELTDGKGTDSFLKGMRQFVRERDFDPIIEKHDRYAYDLLNGQAFTSNGKVIKKLNQNDINYRLGYLLSVRNDHNFSLYDLEETGEIKVFNLEDVLKDYQELLEDFLKHR